MGASKESLGLREYPQERLETTRLKEIALLEFTELIGYFAVI
jgi:hypothetical protein